MVYSQPADTFPGTATVRTCASVQSFEGNYATLEAFADRIHNQKSHYASFNDWTRGDMGQDPRTILFGIAGEAVFAQVARCGLNLAHTPGGDCGYDFVCRALDSTRKRLRPSNPEFFNGTPVTVDVKATKYSSPHTHLVHPVQAQHWAHIYVLSHVDLPRKSGRLLGWTFGARLREAPVVNLRKAADGNNRGIKVEDLFPVEWLFLMFGDFEPAVL